MFFFYEDCDENIIQYQKSALQPWATESLFIADAYLWHRGYQFLCFLAMLTQYFLTLVVDDAVDVALTCTQEEAKRKW